MRDRVGEQREKEREREGKLRNDNLSFLLQTGSNECTEYDTKDTLID